MLGLIFNDGANGIWLGIFENNTIQKFSRIPDENGIYTELSSETFALVTLPTTPDSATSLISIFKMVKHPPHDETTINCIAVTQVLENLRFPSSEADDMFRSLIETTI